MNELTTGKTLLVATKDLAEWLGVSTETIRNTAKELFTPAKLNWRVIKGGKSMVFTEQQATAIKIKLQNQSKD